MGANVLIWTVGHSTRTLDELSAILAAHGIQTLVDVRRYPASRRQTQFNRTRLEVEPPAGVAYEHMPELDGRRAAAPESHNVAWRNEGFRGYADYMETAEFKIGIEKLLTVAENRRVAVMCAEAVPWKCHRNLIADALLARGVEVRHILSVGDVRPHELPAFARVEDAEVKYSSLL